jgi:hypothetical protein
VRVIALAIPLAAVALAAACSSSSNGAHDAGLIDAPGEAESEIDATADDSSQEVDAISPVYTCDEAQLAYATNNMACGQCVAQKCAKYLQACSNCITCQQNLGMGCPACASMCFGGAGPGPGGPGPGGPGPGFPFDAAGPPIGSE